jgi:hypothetical protein
VLNRCCSGARGHCVYSGAGGAQEHEEEPSREGPAMAVRAERTSFRSVRSLKINNGAGRRRGHKDRRSSQSPKRQAHKAVATSDPCSNLQELCSTGREPGGFHEAPGPTCGANPFPVPCRLQVSNTTRAKTK